MGLLAAKSQVQQTQPNNNQQSPVQTRSRTGTTVCKMIFETWKGVVDNVG